MKILWLTRDRAWRAARIFEPMRHAVAELADVTVLERPAGSDDDTPMTTGHEADAIVCDAIGAHLGEEWSALRERALTAVIWEDMHGSYVRDMIAMTCAAGWFGVHFVRYWEAAVRQHPPLASQRVEWLPHSVDTAVFRDRRQARDVGALLTGRTTTAYPTRRRYLDELGREDWFLEVPRPADDAAVRWPVGDDYAAVLARAQIGLSCVSRYGYPVLKTLEIPAAGALLATDWCPELDRLGFVPAVNAIRIGDTPNLKKQLRPWLDDPARLSRAARAGMDLVREQHCTRRRAVQLVQKLEAACRA